MLLAVVEDNAELRDLMLQVLQSAGYDVWGATDGQDALEKLQNAGRMPSLILLDLRMPRMDGWAFLEARQQADRLHEVPVALVSAELELERHAKAFGVRRVLRKPFDGRELLAFVKTCLLAD